ncbi:MAG: hypothetical protein JNM93_07380 [Bacteriovoracaceae bacterium]|nr:hypothetical protein [Bacteriovoracaceae bacterium]
MMKSKLLSIVFLGTLLGCGSYEKFREVTEEMEIPSEVFDANYNQSWQAVIQVMKKYDIAQQNQEAGYIKTRWMDNTLQVNFTDSFGSSDAVKSAKFMLVINVVKGSQGGREVSKVSVYKRQLVEQDFLQGWKEMRTDGILEKTILYRLDRIISIDNKLQAIDKAREKEQLSNF